MSFVERFHFRSVSFVERFRFRSQSGLHYLVFSTAVLVGDICTYMGIACVHMYAIVHV